MEKIEAIKELKKAVEILKRIDDEYPCDGSDDIMHIKEAYESICEALGVLEDEEE